MIKCWISQYNLPYIKKVTRQSKSFYFIDPLEFWKWSEIHKDKIQFLNIEEQTLLPEPEWVGEERLKERENKHIKKRVYHLWTTKEDKRLLMLRSKGYSHQEISQIMNRSIHSVSIRFKRLKQHLENID